MLGTNFREKTNLILIAACFSLLYPFLNSQSFGAEKAKLIFFHSPSCKKCLEVKKEFIPGIEKEFKDSIDIEYRDINDTENYKFFLGLLKKHGFGMKISVPSAYFNGRFFIGSNEIVANLKSYLAQSLNGARGLAAFPEIDLLKHFKTFRPLLISGVGLADGINPCAFTVIVFFISFLAVQGYKKKELIAIGLSFIFAVFLTYLLIGLGLFNFLYRLKGFWMLIKTVNISVGLFSIILGCLALYDYFNFKKTGQAEGSILQLPQAVKIQIHSVIGRFHRKPKSPEEGFTKPHIFGLLLSALASGFLVSLLESVCTGQLYLPTIAFVLKTAPMKLEALGYLLLYNLMFIVPLLLIFILALLGVTSGQFAKFLKQHFALLKIIMAAMFFSLGLFLIIWVG
ncbi:MAG: hypothetical protein V1752_08920 [Candidatus Firestonebacteria bacterium]